MSAAVRYRNVPMGGSLTATFAPRDDGSQIVTSTEPLQPYAARLTDRLLHWAEVAPDRTLVAKRVHKGDWRRVSYAEALASARSIAQVLLDHGLNAERPLAILSDNDIEHLLLSLGAMLVGVPFAPVSAAYSLVSQDHAKLRHILGVLTPGMIFAADGDAFAKAITAVVPAETPVVLARGDIAGRPTRAFAEFLATRATAQVDEAHARVGPDTIAKFLFTSGSTKLPKGVINTQRMICSNQQMIRQCFPHLQHEPPVLVDWLPWNHTFGGIHNVGFTLFNGGTLYIDDGKPTPGGIKETLRNLREIAPTMYFNVPKGFEEIARALHAEPALATKFFSRVQMLFYAGAGLSPAVWKSLHDVAVATCGERIPIGTGLGMTETGPSALFTHTEDVNPGEIGLPCAGFDVKLVPSDGKLEIRYRSPSVMPGYWRSPEVSRQSYDEEGYFRSGDAVKFIDADDPDQGFLFDGRTAEDFKLDTGTWVSVGPLRARLIAAGDACVQDVVITGLNRDEVGALIFPLLDGCRRVASDLPATATPGEVLASPRLRRFFAELLTGLAAQATGSANRVARALLLAEPPSIDKGEITDKGSINQRAVLTARAERVAALYDESDPAVIKPLR